MNTVSTVRDVCLVGGGHSHALLLRRWAMQPIPGVRLTLVSSAVLTPYSGMLPGLIAGHYAHDDIHIDLLKLCSWANVRFIENTMTSIDLKQRQVMFDDRPALGFDVLSLDTGSTPDLSVPGSFEHVTPVKPVSDFHARWQQLLRRLDTMSSAQVSIGVVGSGAGGFELVTAMRHQLPKSSARCYWFLRGEQSISGRPEKVGQFAEAAAKAAGIEVVRQFDVVAVDPGKLHSADGRCYELDEIVWCTAATGPSWPAPAGLEVDKRGFVSTNAFLQSTSHPFVFATGDIGTQKQTPSSKAGVFAVRQAPVLHHNIRRFLSGDDLKPFKPQKHFLSLMATGPQHGIASRGSITFQGDWVWRWKDYIDQQFMQRFRHLPTLSMNASLQKLPDALSKELPGNVLSSPESPAEAIVSPTRCRGCGAKVSGQILQRVLDELMPKNKTGDRLSHWSPAGDTAVVDLPSRRLVQSVDQINAIVDDPYLLGRIAALHAISDVITLNASLHSAQVLLTLPEASATITERDLRLMMSGILSALTEESCALIGGHTTQGPDMSIGLAVNATLESSTTDTEAERKIVHVNTGDALVLTKALGVGTLFAGLMQGKAHGTDVMAAVASMLKSNRPAADILRKHGCTAMTDVTGFGLIGHLKRLLNGISLHSAASRETGEIPGAMISLGDMPVLAGAYELSCRGVRSTLWKQNSIALSDAFIEQGCDPATVAMLADPQTSGGLLAIVPGRLYGSCLDELGKAGINQAALVGYIEASGTVRIAASIE